jgi:SAM-dependent methyltransferase
VSSSGAEIHALSVFRSVRHAAAKLNRDTRGRVLELGAYAHPGLALIFLLTGSEKYCLNNITRVENRLSLSYAQNIYALLELSLSNKCELSDVAERIEGSPYVRIKKNLIEIISCKDAAQISYPENTFDFIFSMSVLEHMRDTEPSIRKSHDLLKRKGWCFHSIDMRDHSNFDEPLDFLQYGEEEFRERNFYDNRLRCSEHKKTFENVGFHVVYEDFSGPFPTLANGETDCYHFLSRPYEKLCASTPDEADVWVTEDMRRALHPKFHSYSLAELSVTGMNICVEKP